jgi:cytoskeletal protein CcmA (bactofilin family)
MIFDKKPTDYGQPSVIVPMPKAGGPSHGLPPCAIIDAGLHIQGDLATDRDVQVDGHINGNVSCSRLTIGKDGAITGDITAKEIVVRGKVKGTIRATRVCSWRERTLAATSSTRGCPWKKAPAL